MATLLKNRDYPLSNEDYSSQRGFDSARDAANQFEMCADIDVDPERYVVREISFLMDSDGLQFLYKDSTQGMRIPQEGGMRAVVPDLTDTVFPATLGLKGAGLATAETPLDLALEGGEAGPAYLVFKLDPRLNWRFSRNEPAITLKNEEHCQFYGDLTYAELRGNDRNDVDLVKEVELAGNGNNTRVENCRLVYFKANPPAGEYKHGFNFHVELIQRPHFGSDEPRILPIIIDPDIRFPGGSQA
jgi:hypothetical protein